MKQSFYLAYKYITFHKVRSAVLVFSIGIIIYLPNGLKRLISESESQMVERANSTPIIVGAKGSATDLVINTLYFKQEETENLSMHVLDQIKQTGFGTAIPIINMFSARNFPIVGTDLDYFNIRELSLQSGRWMSFVGECMIGSDVAKKLGISVGDSLISSSENFFDLAGVYPLKMEVVGVFEKSNSPDDQAIFVDIKTNWVILGLGHGHEDLTKVSDPTVVINLDSSNVTAGAKLYMYNAISPDNIDSFHFHGNKEDYPISAVIFVPNDHKSETIFKGRFKSGDFDELVIAPIDVVNNILQNIFRIKQIFNTIFVLVGIATILILALIVTLSVRLRKNEIYTLFTIGSSKGKVLEILSFELMILLGGSIIFTFIMYLMTGFFINDFITQFII